MKKLLSILLSAGLVVCLAACGGEEKEVKETEPEVKVSVEKPAEKAKQPKEEKEESKPEEKAEEKKPEEAPKKEEEKPEEPKEAEQKPLTLGSVKGGVYENECLGLGFKLPESSWKFADNAQLEEANGISVTASGDEIKAVLDGGKTLYAMMAQGQTGSAGITLENLTDEAMKIDDTQYMTALMQRTQDALAQNGIENVDINVGSVKIGAKEYAAAQISSKVEDRQMYQTLFCARSGKTMMVVTLGVVGENSTAALLESFYPLG